MLGRGHKLAIKKLMTQSNYFTNDLCGVKARHSSQPKLVSGAHHEESSSS